MFQNCNNKNNKNVSTRHQTNGSVESDAGDIALTLLGSLPGLQGRDSQVREQILGTENQLVTYSWNFRQNKAMLVVVFPFLRDYASILDTGLDNMTLILPDFTIDDIQTALSTHFLVSQTQQAAIPREESSGTVSSQKPAGSVNCESNNFVLIFNIFRENRSLFSMRQNCNENIIKQPQKTS